MAVAQTCERTNAKMREFTACPVYMDDKLSGAHEWCIEFTHFPDDMERFRRVLDETLRELNSDYDAKRYHNLILREPIIRTVPIGTFDQWLRSTGKLGGQHKVPRLANDRMILEQILQLMNQTEANA